MTFELVLFALVFLLAFSNGANDISKGIATLVGGRAAGVRKATWWGVITTAVGSMAAIAFGGVLLRVFSDGLLVDGVDSGTVAMAVAAGAIAWLLFASWVGMPVSTTHALVGGILGAGLAHYGAAGISWFGLLTKAIIPLLVSPLVSFGLAYFLFPSLKRKLARSNDYCVCVGREELSIAPAIALPMAMPVFHVIGDRVENCAVGEKGFHHMRVTDTLHFFSSGLTSFARGLNDTPKMAALLLGVGAIASTSPKVSYMVVGLGILVGGLIAGRRVINTLSYRITSMDPVEGFTSNAVTAALVTGGSFLGLPFSTTHLSTSSIVGIGASSHGKVDWKVVNTIFGAWVVTLPCSGAVAFMVQKSMI